MVERPVKQNLIWLFPSPFSVPFDLRMGLNLPWDNLKSRFDQS
jgi:hypothetical protein